MDEDQRDLSRQVASALVARLDAEQYRLLAEPMDTGEGSSFAPTPSSSVTNSPQPGSSQVSNHEADLKPISGEGEIVFQLI